MSSVRVLVAEDEPGVQDVVRRALQREGIEVAIVVDGVAALNAALTGEFDLLVLDLGLPRLDGLDVLDSVRQRTDLPIVVLTGRGSEGDRVLGLESGADDYLVKPFSARELVARINTVLRRTRPAGGGDRIEHGGLVVDRGTREALVGTVTLDLTTKEFDLLATLAAAPRRVFTREQLLRSVWGSSAQWQSAATVTEHVRRVRLKLESAGGRGCIETVRGVGYRFVPPEA